jgi:hypothetical protein
VQLRHSSLSSGVAAGSLLQGHHSEFLASLPNYTHEKDINHVCRSICCCVIHGSASCDTKSMCGVTPFLNFLRSKINLLIQAHIEDVMCPL